MEREYLTYVLDEASQSHVCPLLTVPGRDPPGPKALSTQMTLNGRVIPAHGPRKEPVIFLHHTYVGLGESRLFVIMIGMFNEQVAVHQLEKLQRSKTSGHCCSGDDTWDDLPYHSSGIIYF